MYDGYNDSLFLSMVRMKRYFADNIHIVIIFAKVSDKRFEKC